MAPLSLVLLPAMAIYGQVNPWQPAIEALKHYDQNINILIGANYHFSGDYESQNRTYLLFSPNSLSSKTIFIETDNVGKYIVTESDGGLITVILVYVILILLTWWFWFKPKTHNNTLNQTGANNAPPG